MDSRRGQSNKRAVPSAASEAAPAAASGDASAGARFQSSFDQIAVGIAYTSTDGKILGSNRKLSEMLGYSAAELLGMTTRDLTHPEDRDQQDHMRRELIEGIRNHFASDKRFVRKDGSAFWVSRTVAKAQTPDGESYLIHTIDDIDDRKQADQQSRDSEKRFREVFEQAAVGITRVDLNGALVDCNQKFCDLLGFSREELLGKSMKDITHPDDYGSGAQYRAQLSQGGNGSRTGEKRFIRKDGASLWVRRTMSTACDEAGRPQYVISMVEDITDKKELEQHHQETFDQAAVGIVHTSADGRYLRVNRKFCEMLGYSETELLGRKAADFTLPDDHQNDVNKRRLMWEGKLDHLNEEKQYIRKDGTALWTNRTVSLARDASGKPLFFIRVIEDITARKEADLRYRATFDSAPIGIMHTAIDSYRILHVNPKLCEMLGYTEAELLRMTSANLVHPDYQFKDMAKYQNQMLKGEASAYASERKFIRKDGSSFWASRTVSLARDASGKPLYYIRIIEDISERKRAGEIITRERALLRTIIDAIPDHIYAKDKTGTFMLANKSWLHARHAG